LGKLLESFASILFEHVGGEHGIKILADKDASRSQPSAVVVTVMGNVSTIGTLKTRLEVSEYRSGSFQGVET
jgi:hypothetical protein